MNFSGRVYDGPWEGRNYESERSWFIIPIREPISCLEFRPEQTPILVNIKRGQYRWSQPLRAWVFNWLSVH